MLYQESKSEFEPYVNIESTLSKQEPQDVQGSSNSVVKIDDSAQHSLYFFTQETR